MCRREGFAGLALVFLAVCAPKTRGTATLKPFLSASTVPIAAYCYTQ